MKFRSIRLFIIGIILYFFSFGCNLSNSHGNGSLSNDSLLRIKDRLYKNQLTGVYYFKFKHVPIGLPSENRFIPILSCDGDTIKDINEHEFKRIFNFYVDDNYMFKVVDNYNQYVVVCSSINSLPAGCYFENSNYRISNGALEFYKGKGVTECNSRSNEIVTLFSSVSSDFQVLDTEEYDCCVINNEIIIDGCLVENQLDDVLVKAIKEKRFKQKYCPLVRDDLE